MSVENLQQALLEVYQASRASELSETTFAGLEAIAIYNNTSGASGVVDSVNYKGTWNCSGGTFPTLASKGYAYVCSVAGTISGTQYRIGDWLVYNGTIWNKITGNDIVISVNGQSGVVSLTLDDIGNGVTYGRLTNTQITDLTDAGDSALHYHSADRDRSVHSGTQTASTISDFDTEVSNNTDVAASTTHRTSVGTDHSYINQSVTTSSTPTFDHIHETNPTLLKLDQTTPQTVTGGKPTFSSGIAVNETDNAKQSIGVTINQGAFDDEILSLKSSDVAHGMTTLTETDTYAMLKKASASLGGLQLMGLTSNNATAIYIRAVCGAAAAFPNVPIILAGSKKDGTNEQNLSANDPLLTIQDWTSPRFMVWGGGQVAINSNTYNTKMTAGLQINQVTNDDEILSLKSSDVAHGMTTNTETDTFAYFKKLSASNGGAQLVGLSDDDTTGMQVEGIIGSTDPTDSTPAIILMGRKKTGTTTTLLAVSETALRVDNHTTTGLFSITGNGNTTALGTVQGTQLISTIATPTSPLSVVSSGLATNLNADYWDGYHFSDYLNQAVKTNSSPSFKSLQVESGVVINNFSNDGTFAGNSDSKLPTEKAIKTYISSNTISTVGDTTSLDLSITNQVLSGVVLPAGIDHNSLAGVATGDVHTQYTLLAGRSGGQTIVGGTESGEDLTLQSTSNGTKGNVIIANGDKLIFGTAGVEINEFSNDGTLGGNSDLAVPTEKAVKTYVDAQSASSGVVNEGVTATNISGIISGDGSFVRVAKNDIGGSIISFSTDGTLAGNTDVDIPTEKAIKTYADTKIPKLTFWDWTDKVSGVAGNFTITNIDGISKVMVTTGSSNVNVALPSRANNVNRTILVQKIDSGTGIAYVSGVAGDTINNAPTYSIAHNKGWIEVTADNTEWRGRSVSSLYPIGSFYTQYPDADSSTLSTAFPDAYAPAYLFGGTWTKKWDTENTFFRTEGTDYQTRTTGKSADQFQGHYHKQLFDNSHGASGDYAGAGGPANDGGNSVVGVTGAVTDSTNGTPRTGAVTEPINRLIRVWKRTA